MPESVTAIITFHNSEQYVSSALSQVAKQTYSNFELLIVDDASTDGTTAALERRVQSLNQARLIANETNLGVARSRNKAVSQARGDYIWFIDCDDVWAPNILETLVGLAQNGDADIAMVGAVRVAASHLRRGAPLDGGVDATYQGPAAINALLTGRIRGYLWNKLIKRELLLTHPFPNRSSQSDLATMIELVFAGSKIVVSKEVLYWHVERKGSITNQRVASFENIIACVDAVRGHVINSATDHSGELEYYEQMSRTAIVNSGIRLGVSGPVAASDLRRARTGATLNSIYTVSRYSGRQAIIALLMKFSGPLYAPIYRIFLASRSAVRDRISQR